MTRPRRSSTKKRRIRHPRWVIDNGLAMIERPGGEFMLGLSEADDMARSNEKPQHTVTSTPFRMAVTPVTVGMRWR